MKQVETEPSGTRAQPSLVQASSRARAWLAGLVVVLPLVLVSVAEVGRGGPAGGAWSAVGGVFLFCLLLWAVLDALVRRHRLHLDSSGLSVTTTLYRRHFTLPELDLATAGVVDLDERPEFRPMLRTNGLSVPGFRSGWYRLRNGNRALVAAAGGQRLLRIPTRAGHDLILQPVDPAGLLADLRARARQREAAPAGARS